MNKASKFIEKCRSINESARSTAIDIDNLSEDEVGAAFLDIARKYHKSVASKLKLNKSNLDNWIVVVPGEDKCYATLNTDTGEVDVLD